MNLKLNKSDAFNKARKVCRILDKNKKECYIVGGAVRDALLGLPIKDIDITTNAQPTEVIDIFEKEQHKVIPTGIKFGTVTILENDEPIEVTTYRVEGKYIEYRRPEEVEFVKNIEDDLSKRDFTINAMAINPITDDFIDLFNGIDDLKNKVIRAVGNAEERFKEDPLRMYRACRFQSKLNFTIDEDTKRGIQKNSSLAKKISVERIRDEILSTLKTDKPSLGLSCMAENGLFDYILPEFITLKGVDQPKEYHIKDVYGHTLDVIDNSPKDNIIIRLASMFHDIAKPTTKEDMKGDIRFPNHPEIGAKMWREIGKRLKLPTDTINRVENLIKNHLIIYNKGWTDKAVRSFVNRVGKENLNDLFALRDADVLNRNVIEDVESLKERIKAMEEVSTPVQIGLKDLKIGGMEVMDIMNMRPSPEVGKILNYLLDRVIENPDLNNKRDLTDILKKLRGK